MPLAIQPEPAEILCVIGIRGEGKSEWRARYLRNIRRAILWNPMDDNHIGHVMTLDEFSARRNDFRRGVLRATITPMEFGEREMLEEFNAACEIVYDIGAVHFAIEEIGLVATPSSVPPAFRMLCIKGRHRGISMSIYGQRFHQFPLIARGQASEIIAFRQSDPDDVRDFEKRIAPALPPVPINELPEHHYVRYTRETGPVYHEPLPVSGLTSGEETSHG